MTEFNYGGQAVMEGVMMRGSKSMAVAVRAPNGRVIVHSEPLNPAIYGSWIVKVPFLRGITMLWDTLVLGMRTLMFSADVAMQPADSDAQEHPVSDAPASSFSAPLAWGSIALSLAISLGIFFVLPALLTKLIDRYIGSALVSNLVEGTIRLSFVLAYIWLVGFLPDIRRVFAYHGAEHKTVHAYEHGRPLTVEAIRSYDTVHERCGTSFTLVVVVISVLIFSLLGRPPLLVRIASRIVLIPVVVGVSYEWLKFGARHADAGWMRVLLSPGLMMQKLTTREPDDSMIEVAIFALNRVLEKDGREVLGSDPAPSKDMAATT